MLVFVALKVNLSIGLRKNDFGEQKFRINVTDNNMWSLYKFLLVIIYIKTLNLTLFSINNKFRVLSQNLDFFLLKRKIKKIVVVKDLNRKFSHKWIKETGFFLKFYLMVVGGIATQINREGKILNRKIKMECSSLSSLDPGNWTGWYYNFEVQINSKIP